jgi:serine phosphatase RsbU (regulator of sigma subunit)
VEHVIVKNASRTAQEVVDAIFDASNQFSEGMEVFDDQTVVVLKVK